MRRAAAVAALVAVGCSGVQRERYFTGSLDDEVARVYPEAVITQLGGSSSDNSGPFFIGRVETVGERYLLVAPEFRALLEADATRKGRRWLVTGWKLDYLDYTPATPTAP
ncbi:MAG: hypothetical protein SF028_07630 [Candidatus Sumerlaeia bacterium]|nr:hypothetical protein [Candidatus Sumerlaeia bacterium]